MDLNGFLLIDQNLVITFVTVIFAGVVRRSYDNSNCRTGIHAFDRYNIPCAHRDAHFACAFANGDKKL